MGTHDGCKKTFSHFLCLLVFDVRVFHTLPRFRCCSRGLTLQDVVGVLQSSSQSQKHMHIQLLGDCKVLLGVSIGANGVMSRVHCCLSPKDFLENLQHPKIKILRFPELIEWKVPHLKKAKRNQVRIEQAQSKSNMVLDEHVFREA